MTRGGAACRPLPVGCGLARGAVLDPLDVHEPAEGCLGARLLELRGGGVARQG